MNPVYETMTRWSTRPGYPYLAFVVVRVWRESGSSRRGPDKEVTQTLHDAAVDRTTEIMARGVTIPMDEFSKTLVDAVCKLDHISAVEVLDYEGNGEVFYPDWK